MCTLHQPSPYNNNNNGNINTQPEVSNSINTNLSSLQVCREKTRRFSSEQIRILEEHFYKIDKYLSKLTIDELSTRTQLKAAQIHNRVEAKARGLIKCLIDTIVGSHPVNFHHVVQKLLLSIIKLSDFDYEECDAWFALITGVEEKISWNGCIFTETLEIFIDDDSYVLKYHGKNFKTVVRDTDEGCNRAKEATLKCALFDGNSNGVNMKEKTLESLYKLDNVVNGCDDKENETIIMKHIIGEKCPTKFDFIQIEVNTNMEDGRI
ncbi:unnamed protein product [Rotaria socialis]